MEPHAYTTDEVDDMALGRLSSGTSGMSRHVPSLASSTDERYDGRRRVPSGGVAPPRTPESPRSLGQDDVFGMPTYDPAPRPSTALPTQPSEAPRAPAFHRKGSYTSERRPSKSLSAGYSLYPAAPLPRPTKPLPPLPVLNRQGSRRSSSQRSLEESDAGSGDTSRYSQSSRGSSALERVPTCGSATPSSAAAGFSTIPPPVSGEARARPAQTQTPAQGAQHGPASVSLVPWKQLVSTGDKPLKEPAVYYFDISTTSATLASKHGNNIIRIWSVGSGEVQNNLKVSCYTNAQPRSREYFVRSHAILSEPSNLIAVATGFGDTLEIWDWGKKKKLQSIDSANRWAAVRSNVMEAGWCPLVTYNGDADTLDLYSATHNPKKPFKKTRSIELRKASGLPLLPKYPELAFSATGPLLIHDGAPASNTPYKVVAPWQHAELDTALPSGLATYGSVAVSIWIPASYRAVPIPADRAGAAGRGGYNLAPVAVHHRHVLVWDFSASSTKTFRIPNATSCVSPDCRFVAYCDARGVESGARGCLALLDAMTGRQLWCWPDPDAGLPDAAAADASRMQAALGDLSKVTEMCFSADGGFLFIGDSDGKIAVFEVREGGGADGVSLRALK
ncbi:hypothetical protein VTH06DRAFT_7177 [Thermothelomyces fergusii]